MTFLIAVSCRSTLSAKRNWVQARAKFCPGASTLK